MELEYADLIVDQRYIKLLLWPILLFSIVSLIIYTYPGLFLAEGAYLVEPGDSKSAIPANTLVFTRPAQVTDTAPGDIVTYRINDDLEAPLYTRQVVDTRIVNGTRELQVSPTGSEEWIPEDNVYRKVVWTIPLIGRFIAALHTLPGILIFIIAPAALLAISEVSTLVEEISGDGEDV